MGVPPAPPPAGDLHSAAVTAALRALIVAGERYRHAMAERAGINVAETAVLSMLIDATEAVMPHEIAERLMVRSGTLTAILDRLEAADLIDRRPHPTDRRGRVLALTGRGLAMMEYSNLNLATVVDEAALTIPRNEVIALLAALARSFETRTRAVRVEPDTDV